MYHTVKPNDKRFGIFFLRNEPVNWAYALIKPNEMISWTYRETSSIYDLSVTFWLVSNSLILHETGIFFDILLYFLAYMIWPNDDRLEEHWTSLIGAFLSFMNSIFQHWEIRSRFQEERIRFERISKIFEKWE